MAPAPAPAAQPARAPRYATAAAAAPPVPMQVQSLADVLTAARAFYTIGLGNGETTHWPCMDEYWTWMKKEITCITGYPNHGKSRIIHSVMLLKAAMSGWRFAVYVPENEDDFYVEMAQMLVGRTANIKFSTSRMALEELEKAIAWLYEHFVVVTAPEGATPKQLLDEFGRLHLLQPLDGVLIDPWNQLSHNFQSREDIYLSEQYSMLKRFAIKNQLALVMTAHPAGNIKDKNGKLMVPDAYSISGGKMTNNKFDNVLACHRPAFPDPTTELWIHKIKKQGRVGKPGVLYLKYDIRQARYFPELGDQQHPLEAVSFNQPGPATPPSVPYERLPLPASDFDQPAPWADPAPLRIAATARPGSPLGVAGIRFGPASIE